MAVNESYGTNKLAQVISNRANQAAESVRTDLELDIGSLDDQMNLTCTRYSIALRPDQYQVLRHIKGLNGKTYKKKWMNVCPYAGTVEINMPAVKTKDPKLAPGDRVLVAWVNQNPIVIDVIDEMMYQEPFATDIYDQ